jgi:hypothetical protein
MKMSDLGKLAVLVFGVFGSPYYGSSYIQRVSVSLLSSAILQWKLFHILCQTCATELTG